jgi:hypothetical protein
MLVIPNVRSHIARRMTPLVEHLLLDAIPTRFHQFPALTLIHFSIVLPRILVAIFH